MAEMDAAAYLKRGEEFCDEEDFDRAVSDFTEAYRLEPDNTRAKSNLYVALYNRGITHLRKDDIDQAIADLTEAIRLDPNNAAAYGSRATIYDRIKNPDGVIDDTTEAIRLDPADAISYWFRAGAYHDKSKEYLLKGDQNNLFKYLDLCIKDYEAALEIEPDDPRQMQEQLTLAIEERDARKAVAEKMKLIEDLKQG
jgi:tetratricopeptide (TPR) repeat protein